MKTKYGAERAQMLKYHIQTSGRSLHAQELISMIFVPHYKRYTLYDNCNYTYNAYDEAITTTENQYVVQWQFS
jgi:methylmalonyl-CoA mutase